ncbi:MAG TPA: hypothetical protein VI541_02455, partial [Actinomycetota bacterium]|nr:hypothetical protein [Actinomycetota bacterium]
MPGLFTRWVTLEAHRTDSIRRPFRLGTLMSVTVLVAFTPSVALADPPSNDDFSDARAITTLPFTDQVDLTEATVEADESMGCGGEHSVWYRLETQSAGFMKISTQGSGFQADFTVYQGLEVGDLVRLPDSLCSNNYRFSVSANATYFIKVEEECFNPEDQCPQGTVQISVELLPPVANDDFTSATPVTSLPFNETLNTGAATLQEGEPSECPTNDFSFRSQHNTVWYRLDSPVDSVVEANTVGSDYSALIAVYTGSQMGNLSRVACAPEIARFTATLGVAYYIQIGDINVEGPGHLSLDLHRVATPANDDFLNSIEINSLPFDVVA